MTKKKIIILSIVGTIGTAVTIFGIWLIIFLCNRPAPIHYENEKLTEDSELITIPTNPDTPDSSNENLDETPEPKKISPKDYSAKEVVSMSLWNITQINSFEVTTVGTSTAFGGLKVNISNSRKVIGNEAMITCISAGIVSAGSQRYFKNGNVYLRTTSNVNSDATAEFSDDAEMESITEEKYLERYGWLPHNAFGYVIKDSTYLEDPIMVDNGNNTYKITINLNPESEAPFYYKREIATNAAASEDPVFEKINIIMTIDEDFKIKEVKFNEGYKVKAYGLIETPTETNLVDTYNYDNVKFVDEYYNYFKNKINQE